MVIITGIITVVFLLLTIARKIKGHAKINKFFIKTHNYWAYLFLLVGCIHMVLAFKLIATRYISTYITGLVIVLCGVFMCIDSIKAKKNRKSFKKRHLIVAIVMVVLLVAHIGVTIMSFKAYENKISNITFSEIDVTKVKDGTYEGEYDVGYIYAKVAVEVKAGKYVSIKLLEHQNERGAKAEKITEEMLKAQSLEVDAISGATNSSHVIRKAVENALSREENLNE